MKKSIVLLLPVALLAALTFCKSGGSGNGNGRTGKPEIPPEMKRNGMVSSSTYQVYITVVSTNEADAQKLADSEARQKAYNLICQEPFMPRVLSDSGKKDVRRLVETNGKIVKFVKENETSWSAVLHVQKENLRTHLQQIR